jgi:8-oxo-dGTP pyrophosphatase MutT (NUDIX family)
MSRHVPIILQAGAVVVKRDGRDPRILVARSSDGESWLFPKGHVERGETHEEAAVREVREEAGVVADGGPPLGRVRYLRGTHPVEVSYFLLEYRGDADSDEDREIRWCTPSQAERLLSFPDLQRVLERALKHLWA